MKNRLLFVFVAILPLLASAQTKVEIDGIWYNLSTECSEGEVTFKGSSYDEYDEYLGDITIPVTVTHEDVSYTITSVKENAFSGCTNLTAITIPRSVVSIEDHAFNGCTSLKSIIIEDGEKELVMGQAGARAALFYSSPLEDCYLGRNLSYSKENAPIAPFRGQTTLKQIVIGSQVTRIEKDAFAGCSSLTTINIPDGVEGIGKSAFKNCSNLADIVLPMSLRNIEAAAFDGTSWYNNQQDGVVYIVNCLYNYKGDMPEGTSIEVKEGTVSISGEAFYYCENLTSITIPESVTSIGESAFYGCNSLTSITIPENSLLTSIGIEAFHFCSKLTGITIPESVTSIGSNAFYGCSKLESVYINSIEAWCNIDFEKTDLNNCANPLVYAKKLFLNDVLVTDLVIPHSATIIKDYAFYGFNGFTSIAIGDGVKEIKQCHFYRGGDCQLAELTLGKGVKKIEAGAFTNCENLKKVTIHATRPPTTDGHIFPNSVYENVTLYVPQGCVTKYEVMTGWSGFYNISEIEGGTTEYLTIRQADNGEVGIAVDFGRTYMVRITPSAGWKIHTVTLDGKDVTAQLAEDNTFTTPTLNASTVLNVAYVKADNIVENNFANAVKVRGHNGIISVSGASEGEVITIYTLDGAMVANSIASTETTTIEVPIQQVYFVKVSDKVIKIGM